MKSSKKSFITNKMLKSAMKDSFKKLNPKDMIKSQVMFVAYI